MCIFKNKHMKLIIKNDNRDIVKNPNVKIIETVFALYAGLEVYNNLQLSNPGIKADIGIQNKKGDIFTGGYDTNQNIYLGFKKQLFNTKK